MEMVVVPPIGAHRVQPGAVARGVAAQRFLDRRIDEDALHLPILRRRLDHVEVILRPHRRVDVEPIRPHDIGGGHLLAFGARQLAGRHRRQPDVDVEADLMRGVAGQHRTAARLRHVADENAGPMADGRHLARETFEECDQGWMAPVAVAREAHDLPGGSVDGQGLTAGEAAARIEPDGARRQRRRSGFAAE